jgi:hypothetical protein
VRIGKCLSDTFTAKNVLKQRDALLLLLLVFALQMPLGGYKQTRRLELNGTHRLFTVMLTSWVKAYIL